MKVRVDVLVVEQGLAPTREKAQALILAGQVLSGDRLLDKPGTKIEQDTPLRVRGKVDHYVGRGAHKLKHALDEFHLNLKNAICLDVGASTGGFTQVCLEAGALKVYALDVGHNQLDWSLRNDPRVISMEGVNIRGAAKDLLPDPIDFACIDTSFISLKLVLEPAAQFVKVGGTIVALIKPQHEVGKDKVGKGGIVRDEELHREVTDAISAYAQLIGLVVGGLVESPIRGTTGNKEFLICLRK